MAPKKAKGGFYAVSKGREPGVYTTWDECQAQTNGFPGGIYKKFATMEEAQAFIGTESYTPKASSSASPLSFSRPTPSPYPSTSGRAGAPLSAEAQMAASKGYHVSDDGHLVVYTDGSSLGNGQMGSRAGCGAWWGDGGDAARHNVSERVPGSVQTNNRGELLAIIRALEVCPFPNMPLEIRTDSQYSISCMSQWLSGWVKNNWRSSTGQPVKNKDMIVHLLALLNRRDVGCGVKFTHVKGHSGDTGNDASDYLANRGAEEPAKRERTNWYTLDDANAFSEAKAINGTPQGLLPVDIEIDPSWLMSETEMSELNASQAF